MKQFVVAILFAVILCTNLNGQQQYADSLFQIRLQKEQLVDSTLADRMYYRLYEGCKYLNTNPPLAYRFFSDCMNIDSTVAYPHIYAAAAHQLYILFVRQEQYDPAFRYLLEANEYNPENKTYLEDLAWFELSIERYPRAIYCFKKLIDSDPRSTDYILGLAVAYRKNGEYAKAMKQLDEYGKIDGSSMFLLSQRADLWVQMNKTKKALKEVFSHIEHYPDDKLDAYFLASQLYGLENRNDKSLELLLELERDYPENVMVLLNLADFYKKNGDEEKQNACLYRAVKTKSVVAPKAVEMLSPAVAGLLQNNDTATAYRILDTLSVIYPESPEILTMQCDVYKAVRDTARLEAGLYGLRRLKKDERIDWQLIEIAENKGDNEALKKITAEGYERFKTDRWAYFYLISLAREEQHDSIVAVSGRVLPALSDNMIKGAVYQLLGDIYSSKKMNGEATAMYDSCLVYNPKNSGALNNLAYNITKDPAGDLAKAEKMASKALEADPESVTILDTYAWILCLRGDYYLSSFYFDKLVRLESELDKESNFEVLYHRAVLYTHLNKKEEAVVLLEKALQIYSKDPEAVAEPELLDKVNALLSDLKKTTANGTH